MAGVAGLHRPPVRPFAYVTSKPRDTHPRDGSINGVLVIRLLYRIVCTRLTSYPPSSRATCLALNSRSAARAESMIDSGRLAPGIGITVGDWASIHARQVCWG